MCLEVALIVHELRLLLMSIPEETELYALVVRLLTEFGINQNIHNTGATTATTP